MQFLRHIGTSAITELLGRIVAQAQPVLELVMLKKVVNRLMWKVLEKGPEGLNSRSLLIQIIQEVRKGTLHNLLQIISEKNLKLILTYLKSTDPATFRSAVDILFALTTEALVFPLEDSVDPAGRSPPPGSLPAHFTTFIIDCVPILIKQLDFQQPGNRFGTSRLRVIETFGPMLKLKNKEIEGQFIRNGTLRLVLEMVVKHENCSILHKVVEKLITVIFDTQSLRLI